METFKQISGSDCGICCLVMLTGRGYDDIIEAVGGNYDPGKGLLSTQFALEDIGYSNCPEFGNFKQFRKSFGLASELYTSLIWGRKALITVPSLNIDGFHMLYYDGIKLHDPSNKKTYSKLEDLPIVSFVLFKEYHGKDKL